MNKMRYINKSANEYYTIRQNDVNSKYITIGLSIALPFPNYDIEWRKEEGRKSITGISVTHVVTFFFPSSFLNGQVIF